MDGRVKPGQNVRGEPPEGRDRVGGNVVADRGAPSSDLIARYQGALAGRVAVVTGAGSGIGRACALALATAGADVGVFGRRDEALRSVAGEIRTRGPRAFAAPADVSDAAAVEAAVRAVVAKLGRPSIAVAAAGVNAWANVGELGPDALAEALAVNVGGVANLARAVVPSMRACGGGHLIVIASDNGRRPEAGGSGYVASKFGAVGLALSLRRELMADGIAVHAVEPGCVDTPWYSPDEAAPRERMLAPEDVALATLFLATLPSHIVLEELMLLPRELELQPWA